MERFKIQIRSYPCYCCKKVKFSKEVWLVFKLDCAGRRNISFVYFKFSKTMTGLLFSGNKGWAYASLWFIGYPFNWKNTTFGIVKLTHSLHIPVSMCILKAGSSILNLFRLYTNLSLMVFHRQHAMYLDFTVHFRL